jgi:putative aldouronate transport system substrate-binding protein
MTQNRRFTSSSLSRRSLIQRGSVLGAGAAFGTFSLANAQTPDASPVASPAGEMDADFLAAQDELIATLQGQEGKKLRILSSVVGGKTPEEDQLFVDEIKRLTNIEVELVHPTADYDQKLQADLAAGVQYDLILTNKQFVDVFVEEEVLTDLTEQIAGSAILSNPTVIAPEEWEMVDYDGKKYTVFNKFEGSRPLTIRQDWLDKLGLEAPKTLDEVYDVMVAFRDGDPVGDGSQPLGLSTAGTYDIQPFMSSAGLHGGYADVDGKRVIPYATEEAIPVYEWLAKLYTEGLYDPNFATAETADMRNLFMTDKVGMVVYWDTWVGLFNAQVAQANPESPFQAAAIAATEGPDGNVIITRGQPSVFVIPVNATDPETAFQFLEWWHTIPGITLGTLGILDNDYTVEGDTYTLTDIGTQHAMDHGAPTPYNTNWTNPIGELPGLKEAQAITMEHGRLETLGADWEPSIKPILDENIIKIILGDVSAADGVAAMREALIGGGFIDE